MHKTKINCSTLLKNPDVIVVDVVVQEVQVVVVEVVQVAVVVVVAVGEILHNYLLNVC